MTVRDPMIPMVLRHGNILLVNEKCFKNFNLQYFCSTENDILKTFRFLFRSLSFFKGHVN